MGNAGSNEPVSEGELFRFSVIYSDLTGGKGNTAVFKTLSFVEQFNRDSLYLGMQFREKPGAVKWLMLPPCKVELKLGDVFLVKPQSKSKKVIITICTRLVKQEPVSVPSVNYVIKKLITITRGELLKIVLNNLKKHRGNFEFIPIGME